MELKQRATLRQVQGLALSSQMRMALSLLRMSALDLTEAVAAELAQNPFLRRARADWPPPEGLAGTETLAAQAVSLHESLRRQLAQMALPADTEALALVLVGELREDGILDVTLADLAAELGLPMARLEPALAALQRCEPAGVGARDLAESLALQLVDRGLAPTEAAATVNHLRLFARSDWRAIRRALGLQQPQAEERAALLRQLSAGPAGLRSAAEPVLAQADLLIERAPSGVLSASLPRHAAMPVVLDEALVARAEADHFAPELLARARALVAALDARGRTLQRIGQWLIEHQPGFFSEGLAGMRPLTRAQLAEALALHPSTISRAVAGKALEVEGRLWPLSVFFSAAIDTEGAVLSARQIQHRIGAMIAAEPASRPLSDARLVQQLRAEGVDIARRTVAKYRQGLRIPSSATRRRAAALRQQAR
ncbi:MAG: RNA polymerase factor sigma-54 [Pararhodobacter sp.]